MRALLCEVSRYIWSGNATYTGHNDTSLPPAHFKLRHYNNVETPSLGTHVHRSKRCWTAWGAPASSNTPKSVTLVCISTLPFTRPQQYPAGGWLPLKGGTLPHIPVPTLWCTGQPTLVINKNFNLPEPSSHLYLLADRFSGFLQLCRAEFAY